MTARRTSFKCLACFALLLSCPSLPAEEEKKEEKKEAAPAAAKAKAAAVKKKAKRPSAKLAITARETLLERQGKPAERFTTLADLARTHPGLKGAFAIGEDQPAPAPGERITASPRAERQGIKVRMGAGEVPVLEMVRFVADYTGMPVILEATNQAALEKTITVASPIAEADDTLVLAMLRANGFLVHEENIPGAGRALLVLPLDSQAPVGEPTARPIVIAGGEEERRGAARREGGARLRVAKGPAGEEATYRGVVFTRLPEVLAAQVLLEEGRGVLVADLEAKIVEKDPRLSLLKRYDILLYVNEFAVATPEDAVMALKSTPAAGDLRVLRKGILRILRRSPP